MGMSVTRKTKIVKYGGRKFAGLVSRLSRIRRTC